MKKHFLPTMKRRRLSMIILLSLIVCCIPLHGQNVTVSEKTGSTIDNDYGRPHRSYSKWAMGYPCK